MKNWVN